MKQYIFLDLAEEVLQKVNIPLSPTEILEVYKK